MKRRTRFALAAMFDSLMPAELRNVDIASFYPTERNILKLVCAVDPVQDLHGYDKPWPAGGGKNKATASFPDTSSSGITITNTSSGVYLVDGTNNSGSVILIIVNFDTPLPAGQYTISANNDKKSTGNFYIGFKTSGGQDPSAAIGDFVNAKKTITANTDITQIFMSIFSGTVCDNITIKFQIEAGASATEFEPPENICPISGWTEANVHLADNENPHVIDNVYPISWQSEAGTVYGGTLDVINGILSVTHKIVDLSTLSWTRTTWGGYRTTAPADAAEGPVRDLSMFVAEKYVSEQAATISVVDYTGNGIGLGSAGFPRRWFVHSQDGNTPSGNLVYPLDTPLTYQLTPTQIATLRPGKNNVWCDTGPIIELIS